ncbi:MAG: cation diffusion facilitator family transporter [Treponema sp.]|nr:cation diffusion facilitator family transporter [Treponema sp.]
MGKKESRENTIVRLSIFGIFVNLVLVAFKAFVGIVSNSIAIIMDAINNLTDAFSQVITIVGTKLSMRRPDKKHPYGYGRLEYITSAIIASLVLITGITSIKESFLKIIHPETSNYSIISLIIIAVAVLVKFFYGRFMKASGEKIQSDALIAVGTDSFMDSILSLSTLIAALISFKFGINLEGFLGVILSAFIIKAGLELIIETLGSILGGRIDSELSLELKKKIRQFEGVSGAYDLILHDYGPSRSIGSVHIEVPANMTAEEIHLLSRRIIEEIYSEYGIILTVGIYATNTNEKVLEMKQKFIEIAKKQEHFIQLHGFFVDEEKKHILFDTVISYKAPSLYAVAENIKTEAHQFFPDYLIDINVDQDFSD